MDLWVKDMPIEEMKKDPARWDMIFHAIRAIEDVEMELKKEGVIE